MGKADERRKTQIEFINSGAEIEVGDASEAPLAISELIAIDGSSAYVEKHIGSGLTADIYKLKINGKSWNLKKKRAEILVRNIDGRTSFLNEVQRRGDFERLKKANAQAYRGIVDTAYASLNKGIILSHWIEGVPVKKYTREIFADLFNTLYHIETAGLFEYDLCPGNLLLQSDGSVRLFDFGYMYPYSPLKEFNPDGMQLPLFHPAERFETRSFMQHLMDMEDDQGIEAALVEYRSEKEAALEYYERRIKWLIENAADPGIVEWSKSFAGLWKKGLSGRAELAKLYGTESMRSYILDIYDDVGGRSCTRETLKKVDRVLSKIEAGNSFLFADPLFSLDGGELDRDRLLNKYTEIKKRVIEYQL
ncbi:MAG: hypothetical protein A2008_05445 [Candidatus Wallbacteria bacterium GWC2_49_35]|uniref:Protein kinase domain-containing protein n=1 Tax=Candidatus Wallbacteria bacterium GWC2_49_35 TaxID=1817813 RepID=A0A1F7WP94_9BACT|nr:MAG: hypothetical protein A2008_05445 [Candidatus Wallbacteria bacterium GWC2_49_35]